MYPPTNPCIFWIYSSMTPAEGGAVVLGVEPLHSGLKCQDEDPVDGRNQARQQAQHDAGRQQQHGKVEQEAPGDIDIHRGLRWCLPMLARPSKRWRPRRQRVSLTSQGTLSDETTVVPKSTSPYCARSRLQ